MIEIDVNTALAFYGSLIVIGAACLWAYTEFSTQRARRAFAKQYLWRCGICAFSYLDEEAAKLSTCPRCGSINAYNDRNVRAVRPMGISDPRDEGILIPQRNTSRQKRPHAANRGPRHHR